MSFLKVVGEEGFEPPTLWSQTRCATKLRYSPRYLTGWLPVDGAYNTGSEFIRKGFFHSFLQYRIVRTKDVQVKCQCDEKHTVTNKYLTYETELIQISELITPLNTLTRVI